MITIKNTGFASNVSLAAMLMIRTKEYMPDTCKKLDLYVSLPAILSITEKTGKVPGYRNLRMLLFLNRLERGDI